MTERERLILDLNSIRDNEYNIGEGESASAYADLMLKYIGDTDPELRDDLIYSTFCVWICEKKYFNEKELRHMMKVLTDENHLYFGMGRDGDETVFTRTFSVLVIVLILSVHREMPIFGQNEFAEIKSSLLRYYENEKDLRGYVDGYGWAHGAAHGADAMDELLQCGGIDEAGCREILQAVKKVLYNGKHLLYNEEDERMARAIFRGIGMGLISRELMGDWLEDLTECRKWSGSRSRYIARVNAKSLVRCLYFKLMHEHREEDIINDLLATEKILKSFH
jgi:hypothetical protein